jgi:hypothetical protein
MLDHSTRETEFKDTFSQIVRGFSVLPTEIGNRQFDIEILKMRDPGRSPDDQGALAKKEPLQNLSRIKALPACAWLLASEVEIGQTHTEKLVKLLLSAAQGTNFGQPVAKNSWITAKENAGSYLKT